MQLYYRNCRGRIDARSHGQGMVEFAIVLPILLLLIFGIIEGGHLLFVYSSVVAGSREGARYGEGIGSETSSSLNYYKDCDGIRAAVKRIGFFAGITDSSIVITYDTGGSETPTVYATCKQTFQITDLTLRKDVQVGDRVTVQVSANYSPIVPLVNLPGHQLISTSSRTIVKQKTMQVTPQSTTTGSFPPCVDALPIQTTASPSADRMTWYVLFTNNSTYNKRLNNLTINWTPSANGTKLNNIQFGSFRQEPKTTNQSYDTSASGGLIAGGSQSLVLRFSKALDNPGKVYSVIAAFDNIESQCTP